MLITAAKKRAERRESLLMNIGTSDRGWRKTAQQVLAMIQEERQKSFIFKTMNPERFQKLFDRGFWKMLERDGYMIMLVTDGATVSW